MWYQEWLSRCILFFLAQVGQDSINDLLLLNAAVRRIDNNLHRVPASATNLYVNVA